MIDFIYYVIAALKQSTREPALLILFIGWFFIARFIGKLTVRVTWPKALFLLLLVPIIWPDLWSWSPILIVIFFAGILSNHTETIRAMFAWSHGIGDMIFAIRHRLAYAEIRRLEEENEALKAQLRAAQMQDGGQSSTQQQWKQQARSWRSKGDGSAGAQADGGRGGQGKTYGSSFSQGTGSRSSSSGGSSGTSGQQQSRQNTSSGTKSQGRRGSTQGQQGSQKSQSSSSQYSRPGGAGAGGAKQNQGSSQSQTSGAGTRTLTDRDKHLQTLGLRPGQTYSATEIKAAWRKRAKETHPDAGGSKAAFIAVVNAYNALK